MQRTIVSAARAAQRSSPAACTTSSRRGFSMLIPMAQYYPPYPIQAPPTRPQRAVEIVNEFVKELEESDVQFMTTHEYDLYVKPRTNVTKEFHYARDFRIEAVDAVYNAAKDKVDKMFTEDKEYTMTNVYTTLNAIHDHAIEDLEKRVDTYQRFNDFAWENPHFVVDPIVREEIRFKLPEELSYIDQASMKRQLRDWMPPHMRQDVAPDYQTVAAFDPQLRKSMIDAIKKKEQSALKSVTDSQYDKDTKAKITEAVKEATKDAIAAVDPTNDITLESVKNVKSADELRELAHRVFEYNADERLVAILTRAAELSADLHGQALLRSIGKDAQPIALEGKK